MSLARPSAREAALAAGVAGAAALVMGLALASVSSPPDLGSRLTALETQSRQSEALWRSAPAGGIYARDTLCHQDAALAAKALREGVTALAGQAGLTLETVDARAEPAGAPDAALTPVRLRFTATGSYEGVVTLLAALSRQRPDVFADGVDLTAKVSAVTVSFSGRAFCSA